MRQMMDLGDRLGLTPGPAWESFAPMAPEKDNADEQPSGDAGAPKST
jgi:hypothetical protein